MTDVLDQVLDQRIEDEYAIYNGPAMSVLPTLPAESVHMSIYSPPFATEGGGALYTYTSSPHDLSNTDSYAEFFEHYALILAEIHRAFWDDVRIDRVLPFREARDDEDERHVHPLQRRTSGRP